MVLTIHSKIHDEDDVRNNLIPKIKPGWTHVQVDVLKGGFSHMMFKCYDNGNEQDSITVRINNIFDGSPLNKSDFECQVLQELVSRRLFPVVYAYFNNGYAYQYIEGNTVFSNIPGQPMVIGDDVLRKIAHQMRNLHSLKITQNCEPQTFQRMRDVVKNIFPKNTLIPPVDHLLPSDFVHELDILEREAKKLCTKYVLCHGDCHSANMIIERDTEKIIFVDFEWTHIGYLAEDIGFFLQVLEINEMTFDMQILAPIDHEMKFLKYYLQNNIESINDDFMKEVRFFKLMCLFFVFLVNTAYPKVTSRLTKHPEQFRAIMFNKYLMERNRIFHDESTFRISTKTVFKQYNNV